MFSKVANLIVRLGWRLSKFCDEVNYVRHIILPWTIIILPWTISALVYERRLDLGRVGPDGDIDREVYPSKLIRHRHVPPFDAHHHPGAPRHGQARAHDDARDVR